MKIGTASPSERLPEWWPFLFSGCGKYPELGRNFAVGIGVIADLLSLGRYENNSYLPNNKISCPSAGAVIPADVLGIGTPSDHALSGAVAAFKETLH